MGIGALLALVFSCIVAVTLWEYDVIHNLRSGARLAGLRIFSLRGVLPAQHPGTISVPLSGFKLRPLEPGRYLIRPVEWQEPGGSFDSVMPWTVGLLTVRERQWTLQARFGVGITLFFATGFAAVFAKVTVDDYTPAARAAVLAWGAFVVLACFQQWRKVRRVFMRLTATLTEPPELGRGV
jgi:hypothetical protein